MSTDRGDRPERGSGEEIAEIVDGVTELARALPGVPFVERHVRSAERRVLRELSGRMQDATTPHAPAMTGDLQIPAAPPGREPQTPGERLERLLERSMDQTPAESHLAMVDVVLASIVPDEARILSALSEGSSYPVLHVNAGTVGRPVRRLLSNVSSVGRAAGVALPDRVPVYITRLEQLGLIEIGPEDEQLTDEYEILLTDATVKRARERALAARLRFARHTVRISDFGLEFWNTCRPPAPDA